MIKLCSYGFTMALLSLGIVACGGGGGGGGNIPLETTGTFSVGITDAPVDNAEQVLVQFTGVAVKPAQGADLEIPLTGDTQTCQDLFNGIAPVPTPAGETTVRCVELRELEGTRSVTLLEGVSLDAGDYNWLRLDVDAERTTLDSIIVLDGGGVESLYVPSGSQSGLKLNTRFTILAGGNHDFVVDFDLRKSINNPQGFPDYQLKPSLRLIDKAVSGNIVGAVESSLLTDEGCTDGDYAVYVYEGGQGTVIGEEGSANAPLTSAGVNLNDDSGLWEYSVGYVAPGEYTAAFTCEAANDSAELANNGIALTESSDSPTTVVADQDSTVDFP